MRAAAGDGVRLLALTDHDTVSGVAEALAVAGRSGVKLDAPLRATLTQARSSRARRATEMITALRELGFTLKETAHAGDPEPSLGRPHIARAVVECFYITHP